MTKATTLKILGNGETHFMRPQFVLRNRHFPVPSSLQHDDSQAEDTNTNNDADLQKTFPWQLHAMLEAAANEGFDHIVSWLDNNASFKVHEPALFVKHVLPRFFKRQSKYKSFQRQLNIWQFERLIGSRGPCNGGYFHVFFHRYDTSLFHLVKRSKMSSSSSQGKLSQILDPLEEVELFPLSQASSLRRIAMTRLLVPAQNTASHVQEIFNSNHEGSSMTNNFMESIFPDSLDNQTALFASDEGLDHVVTPRMSSFHPSTSIMHNFASAHNEGNMILAPNALCTPASLKINDNPSLFRLDNYVSEDETLWTQHKACAGDMHKEKYHSLVSDDEWKYVLVGMRMAMMT